MAECILKVAPGTRQICSLFQRGRVSQRGILCALLYSLASSFFWHSSGRRSAFPRRSAFRGRRLILAAVRIPDPAVLAMAVLGMDPGMDLAGMARAAAVVAAAPDPVLHATPAAKKRHPLSPPPGCCASFPDRNSCWKPTITASSPIEPPPARKWNVTARRRIGRIFRLEITSRWIPPPTRTDTSRQSASRLTYRARQRIARRHRKPGICRRCLLPRPQHPHRARRARAAAATTMIVRSCDVPRRIPIPPRAPRPLLLRRIPKRPVKLRPRLLPSLPKKWPTIGRRLSFVRTMLLPMPTIPAGPRCVADAPRPLRGPCWRKNRCRRPIRKTLPLPRHRRDCNRMTETSERSMPPR